MESPISYVSKSHNDFSPLPKVGEGKPSKKWVFSSLMSLMGCLMWITINVLFHGHFGHVNIAIVLRNVAWNSACRIVKTVMNSEPGTKWHHVAPLGSLRQCLQANPMVLMRKSRFSCRNMFLFHSWIPLLPLTLYQHPCHGAEVSWRDIIVYYCHPAEVRYMEAS